MATGVTSDQSRFEVGVTRSLFRVHVPERLGAPWDIQPDGQRFLVNILGENLPSTIALVVNWPAGLDR
jgi:hypothetical protein